MADGVNGTLANSWLTGLAADAVWVALAIGDPGSAGTSNPSSVTTRESQSWGTPSGGVMNATGLPTWPSWAGTNGEVVSDLAHLSASTGGTFGFSVSLSADVTMDTGDELEITAESATIPIAA